MASLKVIALVVSILAFASARPQYDAPLVQTANNYGDESVFSQASYSFSYDNSDPENGNFYGHAEQREGANSSGEYRVLLPDGRTQIVRYTVDGDGGYVAKVSYELPIGGGNAGGGYQQETSGGYQ